MVTQRISNLIDPVETPEEKLDRSIAFISYVFPLLALVVLVLTFYAARTLLGEEDAILPLMLYIVFPNFILIPLELDQVLMPLIFMAGICATLKTMRARSFLWAVITGVILYVSIFISFSLLPLLGFSLLWLGIDYLQRRKDMTFRDLLRLVLGVGVGMLVLFVLLRVFLDYDPYLRYTRALAVHREVKEYAVEGSQIFEALRVNNAEFFTWIGIPALLLLLSRVVKMGALFVRRQAGRVDGMLLAFLLTYAALNLVGQTRSEVGRLWMFLLAPISIFLAIEVKELFRKKTAGFYLIVVLQLVTTYLLFKFQNFA
ncbi:MAG: hypothetical protein MUO76_17535 [Anaerolineaceae bacterium]|nr:hypothetical protein [Anaerolineaceae bacterium]